MIKSSTLDIISNLIKKDVSLNKKGFYENILNEIYGALPYSAGAVYFLDNVLLNLKGKLEKEKFSLDFANVFCEEKNVELFRYLNLKNSETFCAHVDEISEFLLNKAKAKLLKKHFCFSKLSVKTSFFGFIFLIFDNPLSEEEISVVNLFVNVLSYIIKDYELNSVFKTQLELLQDTILENREAYKIIEKQNKKLKEEDLAKTSFLANVSHELRTPLNAIIGFSDVLSNEIFGPLNEKQAEYIKDINLSSIHLLGIINSILDFSKIESGSIRLNKIHFDPIAAIGEVVNLLKSLTEAKEIKVEVENSLENNDLYADFQKFRQILFNLLGNAIKFSPQKGKIIIRAKNSGKKFILEIEDFGIGIEKKYHNFIFKKFTQINNIYTKENPSTGLGLAITKEYVNLHKGKIYVTSQMGKGSTFVVELNNTAKK